MTLKNGTETALKIRESYLKFIKRTGVKHHLDFSSRTRGANGDHKNTIVVSRNTSGYLVTRFDPGAGTVKASNRILRVKMVIKYQKWYLKPGYRTQNVHVKHVQNPVSLGFRTRDAKHGYKNNIPMSRNTNVYLVSSLDVGASTLKAHNRF